MSSNLVQHVRNSPVSKDVGKLCLQWNDFKDNVNSAFGRLRDDKEFTDVTLACEDGQQENIDAALVCGESSVNTDSTGRHSQCDPGLEREFY